MGYEVHFKGGKLDILSTITMNYIARGLGTPEEVGTWMRNYHITQCSRKTEWERAHTSPPCTEEGNEEVRQIWTKAAKKELERASRAVAEVKSIIEEQIKDEDKAVSTYANLAVALEKVGYITLSNDAKEIMRDEHRHRWKLGVIRDQLPFYRVLGASKKSQGGETKVLPFK